MAKNTQKVAGWVLESRSDNGTWYRYGSTGCAFLYPTRKLARKSMEDEQRRDLHHGYGVWKYRVRKVVFSD
jgi:hypothetical protein